MSDDDPNIKALRAAGHASAADLLERVAADRARGAAGRPTTVSQALQSLDRMAEQNQQAARARAASAPRRPDAGTGATPSVPLLDSDPRQAQNEREGAALLAAMNRAGVTGQAWTSTNDLMGGSDDR